MAEEKKTTVIDFQIHEGEALSSLASTKKAILDTKQAQTELNKAYKDGAVSLDQYAKESVQLEASLKKQQASYSTLQRTVTGLKNPFDKLNESIKEQAKQVTVAGVSLSTFANPATAAVGILGLLFKGYSSSTIGAKDLTFASNQLTFAFNEFGNSLARIVGGGKEGPGFFSQLASGFVGMIAPFTAIRGAVSAAQLEELEDLGRKRLDVQAENNQRLKENIDIMEKLADSQVSFNEKQKLALVAVENFRKNRDELLNIANQELAILQKRLKDDAKNEILQSAIKQKKLEISSIENDTERAISRIEKSESNILDIKNKQAETDQKARDKAIENAGKAKEKQLEADRKYEDEIIKLELEHDIREAERRQAELDADAAHKANMLAGMRAWLKASEEIVKKKTAVVVAGVKTETRVEALERKARMADAIAAFGALAGLFEQNTIAYKVATLTKLTLDTAAAISSLTAASEANPSNAFTFGGAGAVQFAIGLIRIFSNIGQASSLISQAAGGGQFYTKGPQLLLVGDNPGGVERVDVTPVSGTGKTVVGKNMVAMAGGGSMMTDAAIMANSRNIPQQQKMQFSIVHKEFRDYEDMLDFKEQAATA